MKRFIQFFSVILLVLLLCAGCATESDELLFTIDQLNSMGGTAENSYSLLGIDEDDIVIDTPVGYFGSNAPGSDNDSPSKTFRAYKCTHAFRKNELDAYVVINVPDDYMMFYGIHDIISDPESKYIEQCLEVLTQQFGPPDSYSINNTGYTSENDPIDYQVILSDFSKGKENDYFSLQWKEPYNSIGRLECRFSKQGSGTEFQIYLYR